MEGYRFEIACPPDSEGCKYQPECPLWSVHHLVPRRAGKMAVAEAMADGNVERAQLVRNYVESPFNKARVGRCVHDLLDRFPEELPSDDAMTRRLNKSYNLEDARNGTE